MGRRGTTCGEMRTPQNGELGGFSEPHFHFSGNRGNSRKSRRGGVLRLRNLAVLAGQAQPHQHTYNSLRWLTAAFLFNGTLRSLSLKLFVRPGNDGGFSPPRVIAANPRRVPLSLRLIFPYALAQNQK